LGEKTMMRRKGGEGKRKIKKSKKKQRRIM
jgi:hypothetical protein